MSSNPRGLTTALTFFKTWTADSSYVLGLLFADGNLHKDKRYNKSWRINLTMTDIEHLEKIGRVIDERLAVRAKTRANWNAAGVIDIGLASVVEDVRNKGLIAAKSKSLQWAIGLPREYERDFVRGFFDGDGCMTSKKRRLQFVCGSVSFIKDLQRVIINHTECSGRCYTYDDKYYRLDFYSKDDIHAVGEWMYSTDSGLRLERKYLKWLEAWQ
jgi:intein-encoded DNA endonuclease-like protein